MDTASLTLADLAAAVCVQLDGEGIEPGNGQISARVDERTLRYYVTLGLLDRPAGRRGRVAVYGDRHVAQAVAVKRLQAAGWQLAEIQRRLAGLPTADLRGVRPDEAPPVTGEPLPAREDFWAHPPLPEPAAALALAGVALPGGAVLLLPGGRVPTGAEAQLLARAAAPLLAQAVRLGLLTDDDEGESR